MTPGAVVWGLLVWELKVWGCWSESLERRLKGLLNYVELFIRKIDYSRDEDVLTCP
ncbi:hypothetical protein Acsp07_09520 [Actinomycetospora sp. NBRC 106378]|nr:hypothetical protein Acsp07_09520 [Actinomycetospora sp. NBRC 106378]